MKEFKDFFVYCPTGTSLLPIDKRIPLSFNLLAISSRLLISLGFPYGTTKVTRFSRRFIRVGLPAVLTSFDPSISSWSICFCAAEIKIWHSAPSSIWFFNVPDESKLKNETPYANK